MKGVTQELELVFNPLPDEALTRLVSENVIAVNFARTGVSNWHPVGFFLKKFTRRVARRPDRLHLGRLAARELPMGL